MAYGVISTVVSELADEPAPKLACCLVRFVMVYSEHLPNNKNDFCTASPFSFFATSSYMYDFSFVVVGKKLELPGDY
jgi:hypothetical protein